MGVLSRVEGAKELEADFVQQASLWIGRQHCFKTPGCMACCCTPDVTLSNAAFHSLLVDPLLLSMFRVWSCIPCMHLTYPAVIDLFANLNADMMQVSARQVAWQIVKSTDVQTSTSSRQGRSTSPGEAALLVTEHIPNVHKTCYLRCMQAVKCNLV